MRVRVWLRKGKSEDNDDLTVAYTDPECLDFLCAFDNMHAKQAGIPIVTRKNKTVEAHLSLDV